MHFVWNKSLALELRTVNQFILQRLGYDIMISSNYTGPKYWGFEQDVVNSVMVGKFSGLRHVVALPNAINWNV